MLTFKTERLTEHITRIHGFAGELMYLVTGTERAALLDTGTGVGSLKKCVEQLTDKPVIVLLTHGHVDHACGAGEFSSVYMNLTDDYIYRDCCSLDFRKHVMETSSVADSITDADYVPPVSSEHFCDMKEGDVFDLGGLSIEIYACPGHTKGSVVMLIREERALLLGDACNCFTFLFDYYSTYVDEYQRTLQQLLEKVQGKYDTVYQSHGDGNGKIDMIESVIETCEDIKRGETDDIPFDFDGIPALIAKKIGSDMQRLDGKSGNIVYSKNRIFRQAFNPYLPTYEYIPDGEPRVFGDRLYIYGSHDRAGGTEYCQNDYVCWSASVDCLGDWRYEGFIYAKNQDPRWTGKPYDNLFAPDVIQGIDGRYYLYYCMAGHDSIGVAVSDTPAGRYEFMGYIHDEAGKEPGAAPGDWLQADPAVLVDDDGSVYVYSGFNPAVPFRQDKTYVGAYVMKLKPDMITMEGERKIIMGRHEAQYMGHDYFEAPSIRKIGDTYYFVYSSQSCHELCYATSRYPDRDFTYRGVLISNVDYGYRGNVRPLNHMGNNHGGMVQVKGQWYLFYHRPTNLTMYSRQGCAEPIFFSPDGQIQQAEMTSCGLNNGPLAGIGEYEAGIVCNLYGTDDGSIDLTDRKANELREKDLPYLTQEGEDREEYPGTYITNIQSGTVCGFKYFQLEHTKGIGMTTRGNANGIMHIETEQGTELSQIVIHPADTWITNEAKLREVHGTHALYFRYEGEGSLDFSKFELC